MEEQALVRAFLERDERAIPAAQKQYGRLLQQLCRNILEDGRDAEECVSDALLALWNTIPPQRPQNLTAYVCRVAKNLALNRRRDNTAQKRDSRALLPLEELAEGLGAFDPEPLLDARQLGRIISQWLRQQPETDRLLFVRRYWFGDPLARCAALAGLGPNAAAQRLLRLRKKLKQHLEQEGYQV